MYGGPTPPARTRQIRAWWGVVTGLSGLWQLADTNQRQPAATPRHAQTPQYKTTRQTQSPAKPNQLSAPRDSSPPRMAGQHPPPVQGRFGRDGVLSPALAVCGSLLTRTSVSRLQHPDTPSRHSTKPPQLPFDDEFAKLGHLF